MRLRKFSIWLLWNVYYICRRRPRTFDTHMRRIMRTLWPWKKFRPSVWHNDDGNQWQIYLTDERDYTTRRTLQVECHIGMESGNIVGFDVWDEVLEAAEAAKEE